MAINLLLDTCVLKKLVSRTEFSGYLKQIILWKKSGDIVLYCPKKLLDEWEEHRLKELAEIKKIIKDHVLKIKIGNLFDVNLDISDSQLNAADKLLSSQVEAIDLLLKEAVPTRNGNAATKMWEHKEKRKAPFRKKLESDNDAMILFSTFEELLAQDESELYFFSSNHSDYASSLDQGKIHPDISEAYPGVTVKYFVEYVDGIKSMLQLGLPSAKTTIQKKELIKELISVDKKQDLIDQLHDYLTKRFEDINVLPKKLFAVHYPFVLNPNFNVIPQAFTLETDNDELYNWIVQLPSLLPFSMEDRSTEEKLSDQIDEKLLVIIRILRSSYVHKISFNHKLADLPSFRAKLCECSNCLLRRSEYEKLFNKLNQDDSLVAGLKAAYLYYKIGYIEKAVKILQNEAAFAEENKRWLSYYIAKYNLVLISRMYRFRSTEERELPWIKELEEISIDDVYIASRFGPTNDILNYLKEANFMSEAIEKAKELALKIKNDHLDHSRGWNSHTRDLLDLYFETVGFMENNFIMLSYFSDVTSLTYHFIDGIFASYTCHRELGGKLLHFTDPIVQHMVSYAKPDDIITCRNRYDVRVAEFMRDGQKSKIVTNLINLIYGYTTSLNHYSLTKHEGQSFFWKRFRTEFHNGLTLASIIEISNDEANSICEALLPFLKIEKHFSEYEIAKTVCYFIQNNVRIIEKKHLEGFLLFAYTAENIQRDVYIHTISNVSRIENLDLKLTEAQWEVLQSRYLVNGELNDHSIDVSEICCLYDFLKVKAYKEEIAKFMKDFLKFNFNSEVYYTSVIHKIIKPTKKLDLLYEADMLKIASEGRRPRIFEKSYYNSFPLDQYINYKLSLNKLFDACFVDATKNLDIYYQWLLDLEGFDYLDFNADWLFNHLTKYYREYFKKSNALKYQMRKISLKGKNPLVSKFYIELYTHP